MLSTRRKHKQNRFFIRENDSDYAFPPYACVVVDKQTGVQYLFMESGYGGGCTILIDADGRPLIDSNIKADDSKGYIETA